MSKQLNQSQRQAIDPQASVRVMANAGAGKTFVLTARVLRLLLKGTHPGKILCLTYTKAAAAEMRDRINAQLEKWVLMNDAELRADLKQLIEAEPDAEQIKIAKQLFSKTLESSPPPRIQTIHSFCQDVLKRFPLESGIQPYFEVVDDITSRELIKETTQTLLSRHNVAAPVVDAINYIASEAGEWKFNEVIGEIISQRNRIFDLFANHNSPQDLVTSIYKANNTDEKEDPIGNFMEFNSSKAAIIKSLQSALESGGVRDIKHAEKLANVKTFYDYYNFLFTEKGEPYKPTYLLSGKAMANFATGEDWPENWILREQTLVGEIQQKLTKLENLKFTKHVIYLAAGILGAYDAIKASRSVIDYNDLIYTTKKLFTTGNNAAWVLYKLDGGIEHILIDEAQDTSPDQWQIILALLEEFLSGEGAAERERTIFIVGDEKQSIYSFQGADQKAFNRITEYIRQKCNEAGKMFSDLKLETSFRSVEAVLKIADKVFEPTHLKNSLTSLDKISHEVNRIGEGGRVELWPLIKVEEKKDLESWNLPLSYIFVKSADQVLAEKIADTIADWLKTGRKLVSQNRPIKPSDILILLRSRGELADMIISRLKRNNIEVSGSDRLKITEHIAIQDLIALANFLLLPADDLSLACVLKSPLIGISEEDLFELSYNRQNTLWNSLRNNAKFASTAHTLEDILNKVDYLSVYELYSFVLDYLGGRKKFISRLGFEVNDILDEFLNLSVNFERSHTNSLQHFVSWVKVSNMEIKRDMESSSNQVRIMTVHGSKGLEAPIVFLADAAKLPQPKRQLVWDENYFYTYKSKGKNGEKIFDNLRRVVNLADQADYDEYLRLLYVAITRARDELYVTGSLGKNSGQVEKSWYKIIENAFVKMGIENIYETAHEKPLQMHDSVVTKPKIQLPQYLFKKLPEEKPHVPQAVEIQEEFAAEISRGNKIHQVFEIIGKLPENLWAHYVDKQFEGDVETAKQIINVLNNPDFADIFGKHALAEVPVIGRVSGEIISGRIDRLVIKPDEVLIVDFKTGLKKKRVEAYIKQLSSYKEIIAPQFPDKKIRTAILWVRTGELELIP